MAIGDENKTINILSAELFDKIRGATYEHDIYSAVHTAISRALTIGKDFYGNPNTIYIYSGDRQLMTMPSIDAAAYCLEVTHKQIKSVLNKDEDINGLILKTKNYVNTELKAKIKESEKSAETA